MTADPAPLPTTGPITVAHVVPTLRPGGPETGLVDLAAVARDAGIALLVVALARTGDATELGALTRLGVPVAELGAAPLDPRAAPRLARALRGRGVQLVHTHLPAADVVGAAAAAALRLPVVSTLHHVDNDPAGRGDRLRRTALIVARRRFTARTVAIARVQREWYRRLGGPTDGLVVVPNGVVDPGPADPAARARLRAALGARDGDALAVLAAPTRRDGGGRDGGHELLLHALDRVPEEVPLVVALAGDGPLRPYLEARVAGSDALRHRVRFAPGHVDLTELHGAADLALHTAATGAQPTALLRATAAGLPVVATRVGGLPEIVTPATGVLVPLAAAPLADALTALATDAPRRARLGAAARRRYEADFEAGTWARRLRAVYEEVLA